MNRTVLWRQLRKIPSLEQARQASNVHYYRKVRRNEPTDLALEHYDNFYSKVYGQTWQSIRLGLLSPNKYAAIVNSFGDKESVEIEMRQMGAYDLKYVYEKNRKRLDKHREKLILLRKRKQDLIEQQESEGIEPSADTNAPPVLPFESVASSESEFEDIGHFLSDQSDSGDQPFQNQATSNLNLNDFVPVQQLKYDEEQENDLEYYQFYELNTEISNLKREDQNIIDYPKELSIFTFGRNDFRPFPQPRLSSNNLLQYYLFDAASALPALLLDIQDGDHVADFCAAPGGKTLLLAMQRKQDCRILANDQSRSRFLRLKNVFNTFVPSQYQTGIKFNNADASRLQAHSSFDKILVDAPCTNDRHSLYVSDNNIFATKRINERVQMPMKQMELLVSALRAVKPGGSVVYSTCSLSPIQNDGVVHQALIQMSQEADFTVINPKNALRPLRGLFQMNHKFKYGTQVTPHLPSNFGPMYFAKIVKNF